MTVHMYVYTVSTNPSLPHMSHTSQEKALYSLTPTMKPRARDVHTYWATHRLHTSHTCWSERRRMTVHMYVYTEDLYTTCNSKK